MLTKTQFIKALWHGSHAATLGLTLVIGAPAFRAELGVEQSYPEWPLAKLQEFTNHASELAMHAMGLLGIAYRLGGNTPENGLDCSGLVRYVFKQAWGANLPRTSLEISQIGKQVESHEMRPGDLVFYNTLKRGFSHVGIYLGDNKFIHSPSSGGQVRIESMDLGYWKTRFDGARRIDQPNQANLR